MVRVIGLMSGTSVDGIDAALVEITGLDVDLKFELLAAHTFNYPEYLREQILDCCAGAALSMGQLAALDNAIASEFALAARQIQAVEADSGAPNHPPVDLIGSHGQTVYHQPPNRQENHRARKQEGNYLPALGYTLQLGRGEVIAKLCDLKTVSNFRAADIAVGGHGAPIVPKVDAYLLSHPTKHRCIQNLGGIGNVTYLPARQGNWLEKVCGWDTGPGNALLDLAVMHLTEGKKTYDQDGSWAASGNRCETLVEKWLGLDFFQTPPPKSTGRELFGLDFLKQCLVECQAYQLTPADILATLAELTTTSIVHSYRNFLPQMPDEVILCGGGSRNPYLRQRLQARLEPIPVLTTDHLGVDGDFKEAIAIAILAHWRILDFPGNLPRVTGAKKAVNLGNIYLPTTII
ncbi:MAG: anhydro-N-acetylmuramic acid kinase [Symploca sp. SIO3C6]|uniref:Anhydro-N-acetylmuramic acid kinase n=1 Tax=Symploca sp. SIO1C4 TaxID=2607765 RepID=A0A6B3N8I1_9CYAN|nr:anhydro-N-acetylmuramic acid kinase [Symploca sp. SIO3C6]NER27783.1 anhydro-N-acetylmuramic acid kinase [Symploca sp. SIO1C4]NET05256.1 anhydro-N-acetylmuramic acid kinase [Symploca sp. SIO2B6]